MLADLVTGSVGVFHSGSGAVSTNLIRAFIFIGCKVSSFIFE
jgi:hypothetical protein